ncbi:MAG: hypothetical protein QXW42_04365 [Thermofilum sp.]
MKYVVISPHNDDVAIGMWRQLVMGNVVSIILVDTSNKERTAELEDMCKDYDINLHIFSNLYDICRIAHNVVKFCKTSGGDVVIALTSEQDHHPLHKYVSGLKVPFRTNGFKVCLYSVDMNTEWISVLSERESQNKREFLDKYFRLERELWEHDAKYYLFEGQVIVL